MIDTDNCNTVYGIVLLILELFAQMTTTEIVCCLACFERYNLDEYVSINKVCSIFCFVN